MLQRVGQGIGSGSVSEWGPASSGVVRSAPVRTTAGISGLGDTSVLLSQVLCSFLVLCLCKLWAYSLHEIWEYMLQPICGLQRAILLETNHRSLLPWVEKYVVRDVHAVSVE